MNISLKNRLLLVSIAGLGLISATYLIGQSFVQSSNDQQLEQASIGYSQALWQVTSDAFRDRLAGESKALTRSRDTIKALKALDKAALREHAIPTFNRLSANGDIDGMLISVAGRSLGITEETIAQGGAVLMIGFGLILLVPRFSTGFATATGNLASGADDQLDRIDRSGLQGQFLGGMLLGAVWSPCIGPTLGGAISLASQGESLLFAGAIMVSLALGVSTIILALGYGARSVIQKRQAMMCRFASKSRPIMGVIFVAVGLAILFQLHKIIEIWAIETLPPWLIDLSVAI